MPRRKNKNNKKWKVPAKWTMFGLIMGVVLATVGSVGALNGWFGGGGSVLSDTMTRGLVGYWNFEEGVGNKANDASNNGNRGNLAATTTISSVSFSYTGGEQTWTVPSGVTLIHVDAAGAQGGAGASCGGGGTGGTGANGGRTRGIIPVTPGETLYIYVGGVGTNGTDCTTPGSNAAGGYGGNNDSNGGTGGQGGNTSTADGGGGGGASDIRQGGTVLGNRIIVASGGAGGGGARSATVGGAGGAGGGTTGTNGTNGSNGSALAGDGGTQSAGGAGGASSCAGSNGSSGSGGNGANACTDGNTGGGGGGGGGYYGGGGGGSHATAFESAAGGGGGSALIPTGGWTTANYQSGNGAVTINTLNGPSWTKGKVGTALSFDGSDDYISTLNVGDVQSVEFWLNNSNATDGILELINDVTYISIAASAISATGFTSPTIYINGSSASAALASGWNHVVITTDTAVAAASFLIGEANTDFMQGSLDEVKIYNRALSAAEVRYHYNKGGPVAHWKFDEGSGTTAYDSTDNNNNGTITGAAFTSGKYGSALSFDGVDDVVSIPDSSLWTIGTGDFTWQFWVKPVAAQFSRILYFASNSSNEHYLAFQGNGARKIVHTINVSDVETSFSPNDALPMNNWSHVTVSRSGGFRITFYINGVKSGDGTDSTSYADYSVAEIGRRKCGAAACGSPEQYFGGLLDDVRIYNYARTPEEIRLDYNAGYAALFGPKSSCDKDPGSCMTNGLVGYWNMEEGSGGTAYDISDYGNHGTTSGGPSWTKGKVGGALSFDGSNDYVDLGDTSTFKWLHGAEDPAGFQFSICASYKVDSLATAKALFSTFDGASDSVGIEITSQVSGGVVLVIRYGVAGQSVIVHNSAVTPITTNTYYNVCFTYDQALASANSKLYVDGKFLESGNKTGNTPSTANSTNEPRIGSIGSGGQYFQGIIDEVRIYNRALSAAEVRYHYNKGGPVAQWKFDEGEGRTAYDSTDNNNDGTLVLAGSATSSAWVAGKYGSALNFDGVNDYVTVPDNSVFTIGANDFSWEAWVKTNAPSDNQRAIYQGTTNSDEHWLGIAGGKATYVRQPNSTPNILGNTVLVSGAWYHLAYARTGGTGRLYVNGIQDGSGADSASISDYTQPLEIGRRTCGANPCTSPEQYFNGLIDDVRIYNYARSQEEVRLDYNAGFAALFGPKSSCDKDPGSCMTDGLVGYWNMEEGTGGTAYDISDYANDGVLTSGPSWTKGKIGGALSFDGSNDFLSINDADSLDFGLSDFSMEFWIKGIANEVETSVLNKTTVDYVGYEIRLSSNKISSCIQTSGSVYICRANSNAMALGTWNHFVGTVDRTANSMTLYLNGVVDQGALSVAGGFSSASNIASGQALWLAKSPLALGDVFGNIMLDEVRFYSRALSAAEVRYHYNRGGPVGQWKFDEGEGRTAYDSTDNNNDGTLVLAGSATSSAWVAGKYGGALSFDGVDDYVSVADSNNLDLTTSITIGAWIKANSFATYNSIVARATNGYFFATQAAGKISWGKYGVDEVTSNTALAVGNWYYVAVTRTGGKNYIYINGVLDNSGATADFSALATNIGIGSTFDGSGSYFNGLLDDVRIYNYARTPEQILQDYNAGLGMRFR